jgi:hypothetical protein
MYEYQSHKQRCAVQRHFGFSIQKSITQKSLEIRVALKPEMISGRVNCYQPRYESIGPVFMYVHIYLYPLHVLQKHNKKNMFKVSLPDPEVVWLYL